MDLSAVSGYCRKIASPSLEEKFIALRRRAKVVSRSLHQEFIYYDQIRDKCLKIYFVLLAAEAAQKFTNRKQLHSVMNLSSTQNLVFWNVGNWDGRFSVLPLS